MKSKFPNDLKNLEWELSSGVIYLLFLNYKLNVVLENASLL